MLGDDTSYLKIGDVTIDSEGRQVYCCGQPVELTCLQFNLLVYLCDNANRVCFYDELLEHVWYYDHDASDWYLVRLAISRLRHSFQKCPKCQGHHYTFAQYARLATVCKSEDPLKSAMGKPQPNF